MSRNRVQPNAWVALKLPNEDLRVLQIVPNTTISLGKYGSFPSNLIIERPFHLSYEVQEKRPGEKFSRLRLVPAHELNADALAETNTNAPGPADSEPQAAEGEDDVIEVAAGEEMTLVDDSGKVIARSNRETIDDSARQTLTAAEIEELKRKGAGAGKDIIAKLLLSHTAIDEKTSYSLAKYKLLKSKKYLRRFTVLPLDVALLAQWLVEDRDASKILEMRAETIGLLGCWADIHWSGDGGGREEAAPNPQSGKALAIDDTGGLLVAAMAERMGILYRDDEPLQQPAEPQEPQVAAASSDADTVQTNGHHELSGVNGVVTETDSTQAKTPQKRKRTHRDDLEVPYATANTITLIHSNSQPNLSLFRYFDYDATDSDPTYPYHPLFTNILPLSWLQLLTPEEDPAYSEPMPEIDDETLATYKTSRRGNYHRKRRRWTRTRHIINNAREGGFTSLAVASTMDPISVLRHALPLLAGGAPVAIYSQSVEPLSALADCFSLGRRAAWFSSPPAEAEGQTTEDLVRWQGTKEFPLNPTLLLGASVQTSRVKRWQVLPGRTHPFMTGKGGAEGYVFTAWRAIPAEGKIAARGKYQRKKT